MEMNYMRAAMNSGVVPLIVQALAIKQWASIATK